MKNQSIIDSTTIPVTFKMDRLGSLIITYKCKHLGFKNIATSMYIQNSQDVNVFIDELSADNYKDVQDGYEVETRISDEYMGNGAWEFVSE